MNVSHAETISAPPEAFTTAFPHILDGVTSDEKFPQTLPAGLQRALGWSSSSISYYELEKKIWETHWKMHVLCRKDPDPRTSGSLYLLPGSSPGSQTAGLACWMKKFKSTPGWSLTFVSLLDDTSRHCPYPS